MYIYNIIYIYIYINIHMHKVLAGRFLLWARHPCAAGGATTSLQSIMISTSKSSLSCFPTHYDLIYDHFPQVTCWETGCDVVGNNIWLIIIWCGGKQDLTDHYFRIWLIILFHQTLGDPDDPTLLPTRLTVAEQSDLFATCLHLKPLALE